MHISSPSSTFFNEPLSENTLLNNDKASAIASAALTDCGNTEKSPIWPATDRSEAISTPQKKQRMESSTIIRNSAATTSVAHKKFGDFFRKVTNVFDPEILMAANKVIDADVDCFRKPLPERFKELVTFNQSNLVNRNGVFSFLNCGNPIYQVKFRSVNNEGVYVYEIDVLFDENNKISNIDHFNRFFENATPRKELIILIKNGMETMAKELGWQGQSIEFSFSISRYPITEEHRLAGMPWHRDLNAEYSMVVLMTPAIKEDGTGYSGGGLNIAQVDTSICKDGKSVFNKKTSEPEFFIDENTLEKYDYQPNCGFLFSNFDQLLHKSAPVELVGNRTSEFLAEKRICLLFAKTGKRQGDSIS